LSRTTNWLWVRADMLLFRSFRGGPSSIYVFKNPDQRSTNWAGRLKCLSSHKKKLFMGGPKKEACFVTLADLVQILDVSLLPKERGAAAVPPKALFSGNLPWRQILPYPSTIPTKAQEYSPKSSKPWEGGRIWRKQAGFACGISFCQTV